MVDFIKLPVVETTAVDTSVNGKPFTDTAYKIASGTYAGTDNGDVYISRVNNVIYFTSIGYGYFGYLWVSGTNFASKWEVKKTDWSSIYTTKTISVIGAWVADLTEFETETEMLECFYDTIVFPGVTPLSGDITVVLNPKIGHEEILVDLPISIAGADTIFVSGKSNSIDPNNSGGNSSPSFPTGTFDDTSDVIPVPSMPLVSANNSGLITLFRPSVSELKALGEYLWTNLSDFIENIQKMFSNPMDYFIAFNIMPCVPDTGTPRTIKLGLWNTNISMPPVLSQWFELDCGTVMVSPYWGSALDYAPNTKISLFLPFIGSVTLNTDEVMGRNVGVIYRIDLLSGQCVAMVTASSLVDQTASVLYQFTGECAVSVPLTGADWSRIYSAAIGAVGTAITGVVAAGAAGAAAGGATAALAGAQAADAAANAGMAYSLINDTSKGVKGVVAMREQMLQASQMALNAGQQAAAQPAKVARGIRASRIANTVNNVVGNVMGAKATVNHAGTISGSAGMLGVKTPYLLIEYPNQSLADNYKHFVGYPSNMYAKLGDLSGYTEVEQVIGAGLVNQTDSEMAELLEALKGGVYL